MTPQETESEGLAAIFESIYRGDFINAGKRLAQSGAEGELNPVQKTVQGIVQEYALIEARREKGRQAAYEEEWEGFEDLKARWTAFFKAPSVLEDQDPNDPNALDPNDMTPVLAAVANVNEYASETQKQKLLVDPFVIKIFERAANRASEFEATGDWLDAYSACYAWLQVIDPNNEAYSDYADELLEKATIAASFEDSPCETSEQRYEGVRMRTFITAVHILSIHYVNAIDYSEMALKALKRCRLLAEVVAVMPWEKIQAQSRTTQEAPKPNALSAWTVALAGLEDQIRDSAAGLDDRGLIQVFEHMLQANLSTAELPEAILVTQFAEAALGTLDPHTNIIWPKQVQDFEKAMTNEFHGIGIEISKRSGKLTVAGLLMDTPAYQAGLDAGDVITEVDGVPTKDMSLPCAVKKITGP
ncbi:MAG: PDZ domain-containing protein, partial [Bacteroidales bacterium]|nr:PDZ domain-containing protein [Bacteroidales bacterium]